MCYFRYIRYFCGFFRCFSYLSLPHWPLTIAANREFIWNLRSATATSTKTSSQNITLLYHKSFIPSCSRHTFSVRYPRNKLVEEISEWKERMKDSHLHAHIVVKTSNLVISLGVVVMERTSKIFPALNPCCTCSTIVYDFLTNDIIVLWRCCCSRRCFLSSLKKLRRGLHGTCQFKIEHCSRLSVLRLFHVDRVVRNGPSVLSFNYHE